MSSILVRGHEEENLPISSSSATSSAEVSSTSLPLISNDVNPEQKKKCPVINSKGCFDLNHNRKD